MLILCIAAFLNHRHCLCLGKAGMVSGKIIAGRFAVDENLTCNPKTD
jgi:hypothetical protein